MESPARDEAKDRSRDEDEIELERTWSEQICSITKRERGREGGGGDELTNSRLCLRSRLVVGLVDEKQRGYP